VKRLAEMAWGAFVDKKFYSTVWAEDATLQTITSIAQQQTPTKLDIVFAEHSMVLGAVSPEETDDMVADINSTLQNTGNRNMYVGTEPRTLHQSGDLRSFMFNLAVKHSLLP
jgi:hypothetical protein